MSQGPEIIGARRGAAAGAMLLECDWKGEVLWMSRQMRRAFGPVQNLIETLAAPKDPRPAPDPSSSAVCFSRLYQARAGILLSVAYSPSEGFSEIALGSVEGSLLRHYFRLEKVERRLSDRAHRNRRRDGRAAIRQIELERQRLGRELHTGVGQMLAAIRLQLEVISSQWTSPPEPVEQALGRISNLAGSALDQVRGISRRLHPPEWQRLRLETALEQLWDSSGIPQRFASSLDLHPLFFEPALEIKALLYRAAQEALSNVIRHSQATSVHLSLEPLQNVLILTISDNGVGFDPAGLSAPPSLTAGIGLRSIREQAADLGGQVTVETGTGGTKLVVSVPFTAADSVSP